MKILRGSIFIILIALCSSASAHSSDANLSKAKEIAKTYMTAFFHGDLDLSFSLMDQDSLKNQKLAIENQYKRSVKNGNSDELEKQFRGIDNFSELLKLPANKFWATIAEKSRDQTNPELLLAMKKSIVNVSDSSLLDDGDAKVMLEITIPEQDGSNFTQNVGLILTIKNGGWVVLRNVN